MTSTAGIRSLPAREAACHRNLIGIVSSSNPEVDRLAGELCRRQALYLFVRRYLNKGRPWEKLLSRLPGIKRRYGKTIGRRALAPGLTGDKVREAGTIADFLSAIALRTNFGTYSRRAYGLLIRKRNSAIARKGAESLVDVDIVVANYGVAAPVFERLKPNNIHAILNYPSAHHRYCHRLLAEEREREPEFASTITDTPAWDPILDRECELADTVLVGSSFARKTFVEEGLGSKDIRIIPYGAETAQFYPDDTPKSDRTLRALFVGRLNQGKGISYLLRAFRAFRGPGTELMIAGRFAGNAAVLNSYRHLFTFLGNLPHAQLADVYRTADVFVFPTLLEGMPLAVLEAMASGLPVITTDHGPGDLVRNGIDGFVIPIRNTEAIIDKLEFLRAHPEARIEMGRSARKRALQFTWEAYCKKAADVVLNFRGASSPSPFGAEPLTIARP